MKGSKKMERLIEILEDIQPDADYETCTTLIDDHILNSLAVIAIVAEIEDEYDITVPAVEIIPDNFNSAKALYDLITRLQEEG